MKKSACIAALLVGGLVSGAHAQSQPQSGPTPQCVNAQLGAALQCGAATVATGACVVTPTPATCGAAVISGAQCVQGLSNAQSVCNPPPAPTAPQPSSGR